MTDNANPTHVLGWPLDRDTERIMRSMAGLVLAELPTMVLERWKAPITDLVTDSAHALCRANSLDADRYAVQIIDYALEHLASCFPGLEPPAAPTPSPSLPPGCDRRNASIASRLDHLHPSAARSALLRHISGSYEPTSSASHDEVEQQITRHERLFATVHGGVYRGLRHFGLIDDLGRRAEAQAWKTAELNDLVETIMASIRADLSPVFSDVIVAEVIAFVKRHGL